MKNFLKPSAAILMAISLTACSSGAKEPAPSKAELPKTSITQAEPKDSQKNSQVKADISSKPAPVEKDAGKKEKKEPNEKQKQKSIEVFVEGNNEMRSAALTKSSQSGYEFYLLDNYGYTAEEPGKDIIFSKYDDSFFVRIEKLDKTTDLEKFKIQQLESYKQLGQVTEIQPSELFHKSFKDASFSFITESKDSSGLKTSILYVVKIFDGQKFAFTFFMPLKEAAEGITPSFWAMLATLEAKEQ